MQRLTRYGMLVLVALAVVIFPTAGMAAITFDGSNTTFFQQTLNNPCVIGDPSCKQPSGLGYDSQSGTPSGQGGTYDLFSPVYKATSPFSTYSGNLIPTSFTIGVDENISAGAQPPNEYLIAFRTYLCGAGSSVGPTTQVNGITSLPGNCVGGVIDAANSYQPATPTAIPNNHNGNGYSDFLLNGFNLVSGSFYVFEAIVSNDTDGMEEFFIVPSGSTPNVPEPMSVLLLGTVLCGSAFVARKRFARKPL